MVKTRIIIAFSFLLLALLAINACAKPDATSKCKYQGKVIALDDGDSFTMIVKDKNRKNRKKSIIVRLAGIDAPEYKQPFSKAAKKYLSSMIYKKNICLRPYKMDKYDRFIAMVDIENINVNLAMVANGYAWVFDRYIDELPFSLRRKFKKAQKYAKKNRLGIWSDKNATPPIPPWDWRDGRRH